LRWEASSPELLRYSAQNDLKLAKDLEAYRAARLVKRALLDVIEPIPSLLSAVSELAWNFHVILAPDDDYDVSFSDPAIPFSVFISVPARCERSSILRVAENLTHETMHLQLTLFEGIRPLVDTASSWSMYSPWKQQNRPVQGVLHGLYVFSVLRWMWHELSQTTRNRTDLDFAFRRVSEIDQEISAVRAIEECPALTEAGKYFLRLLFVA
jgi:HEXXH motif-containing protein